MDSIERQLQLWVEGNPVHNEARDECTPDFSCCRGKEYMAPEIIRKRFAEAYRAGDRELVSTMLIMLLAESISSDIHVVGDPANETPEQ